jgi:MFS family permease
MEHSIEREKAIAPSPGGSTGNGQIEKLMSHVLEREDLDPALDRAITRKFDTHLVPWLFGLWLLAFIDRSNIGNAKIDGLTTDLNLDGTKFNVALTVFYVLYILADVPSNWLVKRVGAGYYLPGLMIGWGIVGTLMGLTKSYGGLIAARLFLGLFEGGLLGGMILYLSMFYRRRQMLQRIALFYCAAPLSGAFGGLLATGLAEIRVNGYNGWPWIFIVEGAITVLFGMVTIFFLPHTPGSASFLTPEERIGALHRMKLDSHGATATSDVAQEQFSWKWVRKLSTSLESWMLIPTGPNGAAQHQHYSPEYQLLRYYHSVSFFFPLLLHHLVNVSQDLLVLALPSNHHLWPWLHSSDGATVHCSSKHGWFLRSSAWRLGF